MIFPTCSGLFVIVNVVVAKVAVAVSSLFHSGSVAVIDVIVAVGFAISEYGVLLLLLLLVKTLLRFLVGTVVSRYEVVGGGRGSAEEVAVWPAFSINICLTV